MVLEGLTSSNSTANLRLGTGTSSCAEFRRSENAQKDYYLFLEISSTICQKKKNVKVISARCRELTVGAVEWSRNELLYSAL